MSTVQLKTNNQVISKLASDWLDAIENIPEDNSGVRLAVRQKSQDLMDYIKANTDMKPSGVVILELNLQELMKRSQDYSILIHRLPNSISSLFEPQFEAFWQELTHKIA